MSYSWKCPYCNQNATITLSDFDDYSAKFDVKTCEGYKYFFTRLVVCPNKDCKKYKLSVFFADAKKKETGYGHQLGGNLTSWNLIPTSKAKVFPNYIPAPLIKDYKEACMIADKSPKASATLSRRCLQGMIRDFHGIKKGRLIDEVNALEDIVDSDLWEAIKVVKDFGNIGAHMEKDINVIISVDQGEAEKLIELIELLFEEWYIHREERRKKIKEVIDLNVQKKQEREKIKSARKKTTDTKNQES